jgi:O-antigen/teichoic acid export membrane protein
VPLAQSLMQWSNLLVFWLLLAAGLGVRAYVLAGAVARALAWTSYHVQLRRGPDRLRLRRSGLEAWRIRSLFGFSLNLSLIGLIESVLRSVPSLVLGRAGGLAAVPVYAFSEKGAGLLVSLVRRTSQAFYPQQQRLFVAGELDRFVAKFRSAGLLTLGIATIAAGAVLTGNRSLVGFLAGPEYFAGPVASGWFAVGAIAVPLAALFLQLLQIGGSLGRIGLLSLLKLGVGIAAAVLAYRWTGLAGLAATFVLLPAIDGAYAYFRGAQVCGCPPAKLGGQLILVGGLAIALCLLGTLATSWFPAHSPTIMFLDRPVSLPSPCELIAGTLLAALGGWLALHQLRALLRRPPGNKASA